MHKNLLLASLWLLSAFVSPAADPSVPSKDPSAPVKSSDYKPPIRVACLGDSITFGVGAKTGWGWPDQLDRMLGEKWDVRNFGHSGAAVAKGEKHTIWMQKEYANALLFHPDVVVIMLGTNDTKPENMKTKAAFPKLYKELVVSFQKLPSNPRVFCAYPPFVAKNGAFGINEAGIQELIPMIKQVADDWGAGIIDVHAATDGKAELFGDNVHPKTEGHTVIAQAVYKSLTGKDWTGEVPPASAGTLSKPLIRVVENPGELNYRETYGLIVGTGMPADKLDPIREKFDSSASDVDSHIAEAEAQIKEFDGMRMKYKHATDESEKKLSGEFKGKKTQAMKDLLIYKRDKNFELIAMIPPDYRDEFGTAWVNRYVMDRLAAIASTLTPEQKKQIREVCKKDGAAYGNITNTPERSIADVDVYSEVYEKVLDAEQKKRVSPR